MTNDDGLCWTVCYCTHSLEQFAAAAGLVVDVVYLVRRVVAGVLRSYYQESMCDCLTLCNYVFNLMVLAHCSALVLIGFAHSLTFFPTHKESVVAMAMVFLWLTICYSVQRRLLRFTCFLHRAVFAWHSFPMLNLSIDVCMDGYVCIARLYDRFAFFRMRSGYLLCPYATCVNKIDKNANTKYQLEMSGFRSMLSSDKCVQFYTCILML